MEKKYKTKYIRKANDTMWNHKKLMSNTMINPVSIGRMYSQMMSKYETKAKNNMSAYKVSNEETNEFMNAYRCIQKKKEKINSEIGQSFLGPHQSVYTKRV